MMMMMMMMMLMMMLGMMIDHDGASRRACLSGLAAQPLITIVVVISALNCEDGQSVTDEECTHAGRGHLTDEEWWRGRGRLQVAHVRLGRAAEDACVGRAMV